MIIQPASRLGSVEEYYFSKKLKEIAALRKEGKGILNLGIGSPDLPPNEQVLATLAATAQNPKNHQYQSYVGIPELRQAFSDFYQNHYDINLNSDKEVLPLMGSKEGIMHISMTYLQAGDEVLIPNPGYPTYSSVSKLTGATLRYYDLLEQNNWLPNLDELASQDLSKVKIMWVNYPNMPTGANAELGFFKNLIAFAKQHQILVVNDNPYSFILNDNPQSILQIEGAKEVALELNSLSKSHNMAGWRVGVLVGAAEYLQTILRFKSNMDSGMFRPLQLAAAKALSLESSWYESLNRKYQKRQQKVHQLFTKLGCEFDEYAGGMFVWAKIPPRYKDAYTMSDDLLYKTGVFITPGTIFGSNGEQYIRASLCNTVEVLEEAIERIESII